jgi:subtilase family serine protease
LLTAQLLAKGITGVFSSRDMGVENDAVAEKKVRIVWCC